MLRFYTERGRFPRGRSEIPDAAVEYVARQVGVERTEIAFYEWSGRTNRFHRNQIRGALGFRECTVADADAVVAWLVEHVTQVERSPDPVREHLLARCRAEHIEPPTVGRVDRMARSALHRGEELLFARVTARLPEPVRERLLALIAPVGAGAGRRAGGRAGDACGHPVGSGQRQPEQHAGRNREAGGGARGRSARRCVRRRGTEDRHRLARPGRSGVSVTPARASGAGEAGAVGGAAALPMPGDHRHPRRVAQLDGCIGSTPAPRCG